MNKPFTRKSKICTHFICQSLTLVLFLINVTFELMAQFSNTNYSNFLFGGMSIKEMFNNILSPLTVPYWFYIFVAMIYFYHFIWIVYCLVQGITHYNFEIPMITIITAGLSFACDTLWVVYFMRIDLLPSIIINITHLILLLIGLISSIYMIEHKNSNATQRTININRGLIIGSFSANIAWIFYRFIFEFGITLQMALMAAEIYLPYDDLLYTIIPLSIFIGIYIISYLIEIFILRTSLRYNVSPYIVYVVIFSGIIAKNYTGMLNLTWETVAIFTTFTIITMTFVIKIVLVAKRIVYFCEPEKEIHSHKLFSF